MSSRGGNRRCPRRSPSTDVSLAFFPSARSTTPHCKRTSTGRPDPLVVRCLLLPLLPTLLTRELKKLRVTTIFKRRKNNNFLSRVEGRSYPPLYRAHKWAKGGWAYLRPSPFGIYVGLPNRDLHRPQKGKQT